MKRRIDPREIDHNAIRLIGEDWMLVTAGEPTAFNTMTASWGGIGFLWNKPVAFVFVRPQRYTFEFTELEKGMTLSFFEESYRPALQICGTKSGREMDKVREAGLTPWVSENGCVAFQEASLVLECQKLYANRLDPDRFIDHSIPQKWYKEGDFHQMYIVEIVAAWQKQ